MPQIDNAKVAILATNGFEYSELTEPRNHLEESGATVHVIAPDSGSIRGWADGDWTDEVDVDKSLSEAEPADYDALVLPGGVLNPDQLRTDDRAVAFVRHFVDEGKIVAAICHGPWTLIDADAVQGIEVTSYPSIRRDLQNAGAVWTDQAVVVDNGIITSRTPEDLDEFTAKLVEEIEEGQHSRAA